MLMLSQAPRRLTGLVDMSRKVRGKPAALQSSPLELSTGGWHLTGDSPAGDHTASPEAGQERGHPAAKAGASPGDEGHFPLKAVRWQHRFLEGWEEFRLKSVAALV